VSHTLPIMRDQWSEQAATYDFKRLEKELDDCAALNPQIAEMPQFMMVKTCVSQAGSQPQALELLDFIKEKMLAKSIELCPEFCRQMFKVLDLDNSGKITTRELSAWTALTDGFLRLGAMKDKLDEQLDPELSAEEKAKLACRSLTSEAKKMALALFDVMDRDGDGTLQREEIVAFIQKLLTFYNQGIFKYLVQVVAEVVSEVGQKVFEDVFQMLPMMGVDKITEEKVIEMSGQMIG